MTANTPEARLPAAADYSLVIARLEQDLTAGREVDRCRRILAQVRIWERLDPQRRLQWARLAQMAGEMETALAILSQVAAQAPESIDAWREWIELLALLDRREEAGRALAMARGRVPAETLEALIAFCRRSLARREVEELGSAATPFSALRGRQEAVARYLALFGGREDCFARQWANPTEGKSGYAPVRRPMEAEDAEEHLSGRKTYGIYLVRPDATVIASLIDADLVQKYRVERLKADEVDLIRRERNYLVGRLREIAAETGLHTLVEFSGGKGYHFWFLFETPAPAAVVKGTLELIARRLSPDLSAFKLEVFPKQEQLSGKGFGNLVKLPLGVHRLSGKRSYFIACANRESDAQLAHLATVKRNRVAALKPPAAPDAEPVMLHPRFKAWAEQYPELYKLEQCCPPLAQVMAACRGGAPLSLREEKVLYQTLGFLPRKKTLLHLLLGAVPDYNPHQVDFRISRLRGTPLGCNRIHSLLGFEGDSCRLESGEAYQHPLLHLGIGEGETPSKSERVENLTSALEGLAVAIEQVKRFIQ